MKMTAEHYEQLKTLVKLNAEWCPTEQAYLADGRSLERYRWDVLNASHPRQVLMRELYEYLNDDHIDTALRKIFSHTL